ncbi:hypothetical protein ACFSM5_16945 [Lacibacterium aquatile]|uniref:SRPBCC family protein n=1 Tax=Lacibacterium aquatile TaxID=1168082 RepID=A0ABW5DVS7_9PROT
MPTPSRPRLIERRFTQSIAAPRTAVHPLLCPERECDWLPGWSYRMIRSESGLAELGAVFATPYPSGGESIWIVTRHYVPTGVGFIRLQPDGLLVEIEIDLRPDGADRCFVDILYRYTAVSEVGEVALATLASAQWQTTMEHWEGAMNRWFALAA